MIPAAEINILKKPKKSKDDFRVLYNQYFEQIFDFVFRKCNDYETAGDLTSNVFVKAWQSLNEFKYEGVPFSAWLYRVASNECNSFFRKQKNVRFLSIDETGLHQIAEEIETGLTEAYLNQIPDLLEQLETSEINLIELRFFERFSIREIAYQLNLTESNTKVKLHRTLKKLKKIICP
ncbi:MAG: sigma-70 family RNA polymerase sigma factor [Cyclobacteriaceae bacterium]|nr:sigma-70 family RNA polymerase sigma factor [Cyclobacteriaceae bacterium HetDA_MAG_MS6]